MKHVETIYGVHAVRAMLTRHPERVVTVRLTETRDDPRARGTDGGAHGDRRRVTRRVAVTTERGERLDETDERLLRDIVDVGV